MWPSSGIAAPPVRVLMLQFESHDIWNLNEVAVQVRAAFQRNRFDVVDYRIPMTSSSWYLSRRLESFLKLGDANTVLIIYYNGHGVRDGGELWLGSHGRSGAAMISWGTMKNLILPAERDVGIILDCCNAGAAAVPRTTIQQINFQGRPKEIIAASSWSEYARGRMSIALSTVLNNWNPNMGDSLSMETLYERMVVLLAQESGVAQPVRARFHDSTMGKVRLFYLCRGCR